MNDQIKATTWAQWMNGSPMISIAKTLGKPPTAVFSYLRYHGGIRPCVRARSPVTLTIEEREEHSRGLAVNDSLRTIAYSLGRSPSTISREINKSGGAKKYRATEADNAACKRAKRPKSCLLSVNQTLKSVVTGKLSEDWSPEQMSGWLTVAYRDDISMRESIESHREGSTGTGRQALFGQIKQFWVESGFAYRGLVKACYCN